MELGQTTWPRRHPARAARSGEREVVHRELPKVALFGSASGDPPVLPLSPLAPLAGPCHFPRVFVTRSTSSLDLDNAMTKCTHSRFEVNGSTSSESRRWDRGTSLSSCWFSRSVSPANKYGLLRCSCHLVSHLEASQFVSGHTSLDRGMPQPNIFSDQH